MHVLLDLLVSARILTIRCVIVYTPLRFLHPRMFRITITKMIALRIVLIRSCMSWILIFEIAYILRLQAGPHVWGTLLDANASHNLLVLSYN